MRMFIFALEHGQGWKVQRRTHKQTERRSCRLILPSPMLLRCSFAVPKLPSTYSRTHGTMKEEHDERGGGEREAERRVATLQCESRTPICCCARPLPTTVPTSAIRRCISPGGPPAGPPARAREDGEEPPAGSREIAVLVTPTLRYYRPRRLRCPPWSW